MEKVAPRFAGRHLITLEDFTKEEISFSLLSKMKSYKSFSLSKYSNKLSSLISGIKGGFVSNLSILSQFVPLKKGCLIIPSYVILFLGLYSNNLFIRFSAFF